MKKLVIASLVLFSIAYNFSVHKKSITSNTSLSVKNIQALADGESGGGIYCVDWYDCLYEPFDVCVYCDTPNCYSYAFDLNEYGNPAGSC